MAYTKTVWADEVLAAAERFTVLDDIGGAVDAFADLAKCQITLQTTVTSAGTPLSAANMNNIENGIEAISTGIARSIKGVSANIPGDVANIQAGGDGQVLIQDGTILGFGLLKTASLGNSIVTPAKTSFLNDVPNARLFAGQIVGSGTGVTVNSPMGWTGTRLGVGYYRITHNLGTINYAISFTPTASGISLDYCEFITNYFDVHLSGGEGTVHFMMMIYNL